MTTPTTHDAILTILDNVTEDHDEEECNWEICSHVATWRMFFDTPCEHIAPYLPVCETHGAYHRENSMGSVGECKICFHMCRLVDMRRK